MNWHKAMEAPKDGAKCLLPWPLNGTHGSPSRSGSFRSEYNKFALWAAFNGYYNGCAWQLVRKDPSQPYSPENCTWNRIGDERLDVRYHY